MKHYSTVVIGGGAAGIMAAGVAAATGHNVLLCERMEKPQRKVRITGKGRCHLTNLCDQEEFLDMHGNSLTVKPPCTFSNKSEFH